MKRIEIKLSIDAMQPLLPIIRDVARTLDGRRAVIWNGPDYPEEKQVISSRATDDDLEMQALLHSELVKEQRREIDVLLGLFSGEFLSSGTIVIDEESMGPVMRASAAVRLRIREMYLAQVPDEILEDGSYDAKTMNTDSAKAMRAYIFLAALQELVIEHFGDILMGEA